MNKKIHHAIFIIVVLLSACNLPGGQQGGENNGAPNASTQAAQTVEALLTQQAQQVVPPPAFTSTTAPVNNVPPTNTPIPSPTNTTAPLPTATQNCDAMKFVADVTVPDGTVMTPGQVFTKTWRIQNTGTCSWTTSYASVFSTGNAMGGPSTQALAGNVNPGSTMDVSMTFTAPNTNGDYTAYYKLRNAAGVLFGQFYVQIKVGSSGSGGSNPGPFAVTSVTYSATTFTEGSYVNCPLYTANITVNGPGVVKFRWKVGNTTQDIETLNFNAAGTKSVSDKWYVGPAAPPPLTIGIYIEDPNHQDFGTYTISPCTGYP